MRNRFQNSTITNIFLQNSIPVLIYDEGDLFDQTLSEIVSPFGFTFSIENNEEDVIRSCQEVDYKVLIIDLKTAKGNSSNILKTVKRIRPHIRIIYVLGWGIDAEFVINDDVFDFIRKPIDPDRVIVTIKNAADTAQLDQDRAYLLKEAKRDAAVIGRTREISDIRMLIEMAGPSGSNVLIQGEPGTGRELIARAIHIKSSRAARPFISVNAKDMDSDLLEKELFGSITKFAKVKKGLFSKVKHGTIYFEDICDVEPVMQAKILSYIEQGTVEVRGGSLKIVNDLRIIASTKRDPKKSTQIGRLRKDLFYRLNVINIKVPPLRDRKNDIPVLFDYFSEKFSKMYDCSGKKITPDVMKIIKDYDWPGNVEELRNFTERLYLFFKAEIKPEHVGLLLKKWE